MTISVLQQLKGTDVGNTGGLTAVVTPTLTAGSACHLIVSCDGNFDISTVASVPVETWTLLDNINETTNGQRYIHYAASNVTGGSTAITATFNSALTPFRAIAVKEIGESSGYDSSAGAHKGQRVASPGTGADGLSSGNMPVLSAQPALISGWGCNPSGPANNFPTQGTGFTSNGVTINFGFGATNETVRGESKRVTATTAAAATFTAVAGTTPQLAFAAAFIETGAGGAVEPSHILLQGVT